MLPFFLKTRLIFVTCACEVGVGEGGEGLRWLETPTRTSEWKIFPLVVKVEPRSQS